MFSFTTQTIYNTITPATDAQVKSGAVKNANLITSTGGRIPSVRIGNTRFDLPYVTDIQIKAPSKESLASVTFDMADVIPSEGETTGRIALYLGLSMGSQDSFYSNALVYKGKPFYVEFPVKSTDTADVIAKRVKAIADKYILFETGEKDKILNVSITATAAVGADPGPAADAVGTVTFTGVNGYQLIKKALLQSYDPKAYTIDCCSDQGDFITIKTGVPVIYTIDGTSGLAVAGNPAQKLDETGEAVALAEDEIAILPGLEAFGDYNWIIHNLRLPTAANTGFWSVTKQMGELPIPGQEYTQFIITMCVDRDGIAGQVVGNRATSVTTHVIYAAGKIADASGAAKEIYTALNTLFSAKIKKAGDSGAADTVLAQPYA